MRQINNIWLSILLLLAMIMAAGAQPMLANNQQMISDDQVTSNNTQMAPNNMQTTSNNAQTTSNNAQPIANNAQTTGNNAQMIGNNTQVTSNNTQMVSSNTQMNPINTQRIGSSQMMSNNTMIVADNSTNVLDEIRGDHAKLLVLAENIEILRSSNQTDAATQNFSKLMALASAHMSAEEQVFYPALETGKVNREVMLSAREEHNLTKQEGSTLQKLPIQSDEWSARFDVMTDVTKHHMDEEESAIFAIAKKDLSAQQLDNLGIRFRQAEGTMPS